MSCDSDEYLPEKPASEKLKVAHQQFMETRLDTGDPVRFKKATSADAPGLLDLIRKYFDYDGIPFDPDEIRSSLSELLNDESIGQAWLIERGLKTVGYVIFTYGFDLEF